MIWFKYRYSEGFSKLNFHHIYGGKSWYSHGRKSWYSHGRKSWKKSWYSHGRKSWYSHGRKSPYSHSRKSWYSHGRKSSYLHSRKSSYSHGRKSSYSQDGKLANPTCKPAPSDKESAFTWNKTFLKPNYDNCISCLQKHSVCFDGVRFWRILFCKTFVTSGSNSDCPLVI